MLLVWQLSLNQINVNKSLFLLPIATEWQSDKMASDMKTELCYWRKHALILLTEHYCFSRVTVDVRGKPCSTQLSTSEMKNAYINSPAGIVTMRDGLHEQYFLDNCTNIAIMKKWDASAGAITLRAWICWLPAKEYNEV